MSRKCNAFSLRVSALFSSVALPPSFFGWSCVTVTIVIRSCNHACHGICFVDICKKVRNRGVKRIQFYALTTETVCTSVRFLFPRFFTQGKVWREHVWVFDWTRWYLSKKFTGSQSTTAKLYYRRSSVNEAQEFLAMKYHCFSECRGSNSCYTRLLRPMCVATKN